ERHADLHPSHIGGRGGPRHDVPRQAKPLDQAPLLHPSRDDAPGQLLAGPLSAAYPFLGRCGSGGGGGGTNTGGGGGGMNGGGGGGGTKTGRGGGGGTERSGGRRGARG